MLACTLLARTLLLLVLAAGCAPRLAAGDAAERPAVADVSVVREPAGGAVVLVQLSLGGEAGGWVPISAARPLRVETPAGTFEAAIDGAPERYVVHVTEVSSARYRLAEAGVVALDAAGGSARVSVHDGTTYRTYAVRRVDFAE